MRKKVCDLLFQIAASGGSQTFDQSLHIVLNFCGIIGDFQSEITVSPQFLIIDSGVCRLACIETDVKHRQTVCSLLIRTGLADPFSEIIIGSPDLIDKTGAFFQYFNHWITLTAESWTGQPRRQPESHPGGTAGWMPEPAELPGRRRRLLRCLPCRRR